MVLALLAFLLVLLFVLGKGSDFFVESVSKIAKVFGVSEFVIGITVVSVGTTLPEVTTSLVASFAGETELAVGNIVGSVIANIGLILGSSAIILALRTNRRIFIRDALILFSIACLFLFFSADGTIVAIEGWTLFSLTIIHIAYLLHFRPDIRAAAYQIRDYLGHAYEFTRFRQPPATPKKLEKALKQEAYDDFVGKGFDLESYHKIDNRISLFRTGIAKNIAIALVGAAMIYFSVKYIIPTAIELATLLGISDTVIGVTLLALGTSLPELFVAISSVRKGYNNLLLGNIIGACIFNMTLVGGLSSIANTLPISATTLSFSLPFMVLIIFALLIFVRTGWGIRRHEGLVLFSLYVLFLYLILKQTSLFML